LAYWRLDEKKNSLAFVDSASTNNKVTFDPVPAIGKTVGDLIEMREIYLKFCPEGTYMYFNETLGFYNCSACHPDCGNCNGPTNKSCTSYLGDRNFCSLSSDAWKTWLAPRATTPMRTRTAGLAILTARFVTLTISTHARSVMSASSRPTSVQAACLPAHAVSTATI
jgi:hypothetical protein